MTAPKKTDLTRCEVDIIHEDLVHAAQPDLLDGLTATRMAQIFQALSDPTRVRLISSLFSTELCVCDIAAILGMTQSAVSHQLRLLRDQRLVKARKEGRVVYYTLDDEHIKDLMSRTLEHIKHGESANT